MTVVLILLALAVGGVGFATLSPATSGVGWICGGCMLAIFARIAQAWGQSAELEVMNAYLKAINARAEKKPGAYAGEFAPPEHGER